MSRYSSNFPGKSALRLCAVLLFLGLHHQNLIAHTRQDVPKAEIYDPHMFFVVLRDDQGGERTRNILNDVREQRSKSGVSRALRTYIPERAGTLLPPPVERKQIQPKSTIPYETARERLARVMVVRFRKDLLVEDIKRELAADPEIAYFSQVTAPQVTDHQPSYDFGTDGEIVVNRTWGFDRVRAGQAHVFQEGHALIGVADLGVQPDHPELRDYVGNQWEGGNYHPAQSFSVGDGLISGGTAGNPYIYAPALGQLPSAGGIVGHADEYFVAMLPRDLVQGCDVNNNSFSEAWAAGHGTHVSGIIAANSVAGSVDVEGICATCPLMIGSFSTPTACTQGTHYDQIEPIEAFTGIPSQVTMLATVGFLIDGGAQVINLSARDIHPGCPEPIDLDDDTRPECLLIQYAVDRDVILVASTGNDNFPALGFPANDSRVVGVGAIDINEGRWVLEGVPAGHSGAEHGSNYGSAIDWITPASPDSYDLTL